MTGFYVIYFKPMIFELAVASSYLKEKLEEGGVVFRDPSSKPKAYPALNITTANLL